MCIVSDKNNRPLWNLAVDIGDRFFWTHYAYPIVQCAAIFKHVDVFVLAGCRRSIRFVLIQVIHFMFIARNNGDDDLMIRVI